MLIDCCRKTKDIQPLDPLSFLPHLAQHIQSETKRFKIDYIELTKSSNGLLKSLLDSQKIDLPDHALDPNNYYVRGNRSEKLAALSNSSNTVFVHLVKQSLWEDKEWELAEPERKAMAKKTTGIMGRKKYIAIAGRLCEK